MMMIQDGPMPTGADKPLRISGDPYKVQVSQQVQEESFCRTITVTQTADLSLSISEAGAVKAEDASSH